MFKHGTGQLNEILDQVRRDTWTPRKFNNTSFSREIKYMAAVSRHIGFPVGQAASRRRGLQGVDGRPVLEMMRLGAAPEIAAEICADAFQSKVWAMGYGSPRSVPAAVLLTLYEWGKGPETEEYDAVADIWANSIDYDHKQYLTRRDGRLHPDWRTRNTDWMSTQMFDNFEIGVQARRHIRRLRKCGYENGHSRLIAIGWASNDANAHKKQLWALRKKYGTVRANWFAMGFTPPRGVILLPCGLSAKSLKKLMSGEDASLPLTWDHAVCCLSVWGGLAHAMKAAMGLHDSTQVYGNDTQDRGRTINLHPNWEKYRDKHSRWILSNAYRSLRLPIMVERISRQDGAGDVLDYAPEALLALDSFNELPADARVWMDQAKQVNRTMIPTVDINADGVRIRTLDRTDVTAFQLGQATHCCMHVGGTAESCLKHGITRADGGFWVVTGRNGGITAQSWVWRAGDTIVVDNIEATTTSQGEHERILPLYIKAAQSLLGRLGINRVLVGTGYTDIDLPLDNVDDVPCPPINTYTDTSTGCKLLAGINCPTRRTA